MSFPTFGISRAKDELPSPVDACLKIIQKGLDSITARMLLQESYETLYQICNHDSPVVTKMRPLALVAMQPKENVADYSKLYRTVVRYKDHNILGTFGLNLKEFLDMPHEMVELMFKLSLIHAQKNNATVSKALKDMENGSGS